MLISKCPAEVEWVARGTIEEWRYFLEPAAGDAVLGLSTFAGIGWACEKYKEIVRRAKAECGIPAECVAYFGARCGDWRVRFIVLWPGITTGMRFV